MRMSTCQNPKIVKWELKCMVTKGCLALRTRKDGLKDLLRHSNSPHPTNATTHITNTTLGLLELLNSHNTFLGFIYPYKYSSVQAPLFLAHTPQPSTCCQYYNTSIDYQTTLECTCTCIATTSCSCENVFRAPQSLPLCNQFTNATYTGQGQGYTIFCVG